MHRSIFKMIDMCLLSQHVDSRLSTQQFGDIKNVHIIADEILVVGDTEQEHDEALTAVLQ